MEKELTMNDYIRSIPTMISENIKLRKEITNSIVEEFLAKKYSKIIIVASGSSYNASITARLMMQKVLKIPVEVISPYTFTYYENQFLDDCFIVISSQSGNSTNSLRAINKVKELGLKLIGVSADDNSDFNKYCDLFVNYNVGVETVGFVTRGMVGLVLFYMLFALEAAVEGKQITKKEYESYINKLKKTPKLYQETYDRTVEFYENNRHELLSIEKLLVMGCGPSFGVALEGALKVGETMGIPSFAYESEEFLHGPSFCVNGNYTCLFIDNNDETSERLKTIVETTRIFTDRCYFITNDKKLKKSVYCKEIDPYISVIYKLAVPEYLAYRITNDLNRWPIEELAEEYDQHVRIKSKSPK